MTQVTLRGYVVRKHDGQTYDLRPGTHDLPDALAKSLREAGALVQDAPQDDATTPAEVFGENPPRPAPTSVADGGDAGAKDPDPPPDPTAQTSGGSGSDPVALPDGAPDASTADVAELAKYIDSEKLNAPTTVALAKGDPALASKVLEAEKTAKGGDSRSTVTKPLEALAASGSDPS